MIFSSLSRWSLLLAALAPLLAACSPAKLLNTLTSSRAYIAQNAIAYGADARQRLDVYVPRGDAVPNGRPVVVFFYGGSWNSGARGDYAFVGEALAARGFIAVIADYRLYPQVRYPDFLEDCAAAVAWTQREIAGFGGDPHAIFLMGHSAGAYNAAMLALDPRWLWAQGVNASALKGWVGLAGPYDFFPSNNPAVQPVFTHPNYPSGAQPIEYTAGSTLPAFIGAARDDTLVNPQRNSEQLAQRLSAAGTPVTFKLYERVNHITLIGAWGWPLRWLAPVLDDVTAFLRANSPQK